MGPLDEGDASLGRAVDVARVEEADVDPVGVPGVDGDVGAALDQGDPGGRREVAAEGSRGRLRGGAGEAWRRA